MFAYFHFYKFSLVLKSLCPCCVLSIINLHLYDLFKFQIYIDFFEIIFYCKIIFLNPVIDYEMTARNNSK